MNLRPHRRRVPIIPIVSMIDILVILLIFFIATTTFRGKPKTHLKIALPESQALGGTAAQPEVRTSITVTKDQKLFLDGEPIAVEKLAESLTALKAANPNARLELEADTDTALGLLVKVWDALRAAGYSVNEVPARIERTEEPKP
jgi:biopolymer transport protein ExbD